MHRSLVALLAVGPVLAAPAVKERGPVLYHPVKVGTKRVWQSQLGDRKYEVEETVVKVEVKDGVYRVTVETDQSGQDRTRGAVEVSAKGIFRLTGGGKELDTPVPVLKLPAEVGSTWELGTEATATTYTVLAVDEVVVVPAGKFKCIRIESAAGFGPLKRTAVSWYAPRVGLVKTEGGGGQPGVLGFVRQLTSFTLGP